MLAGQGREAIKSTYFALLEGKVPPTKAGSWRFDLPDSALLFRAVVEVTQGPPNSLTTIIIGRLSTCWVCPLSGVEILDANIPEGSIRVAQFAESEGQTAAARGPAPSGTLTPRQGGQTDGCVENVSAAN